MNKELMRAMGYGFYVDQVERGNCPICGLKVDTNKFKTEIERDEFEISGMCKSCQDETFRKN